MRIHIKKIRVIAGTATALALTTVQKPAVVA